MKKGLVEGVHESMTLTLTTVVVVTVGVIDFTTSATPTRARTMRSIAHSAGKRSILLSGMCFTYSKGGAVSSQRPVPTATLSVRGEVLKDVRCFCSNLSSSKEPRCAIGTSVASGPLGLGSDGLMAETRKMGD